MSYYCGDCPRKCGAPRPDGIRGEGFCGCGDLISVARVMRHEWEEPVLCGDTFTDNVFFYGCNLKCVYCQNHVISRDPGFPEKKLKTYTDEGFRVLLSELDASPGKTIGLVTGDHFIRQIARAVTPEFKSSLRKPVVFNCSGYQTIDSLELLKGKADVFMPDFKYVDGALAKALSNAPDYPETAKAFIAKAFEITGPAVIGPDGIMRKGVLIRHLILPGNLNNTLGVIDLVNDTFRPGDIVFSLMSQYVPAGDCADPAFRYPNLTRRISRAELKKAIDYLDACENITVSFTQDITSSSAEYVPDF